MKDPLLHQKLGPYRLERVLGRGGMGTVYAATDETSGQVAAVKLLSPALASDPSFRERFAAEIESLKKLHHPHIVQLFGYGEQDGQLYYSMELIEGSNLQEELRRGRRFTWRDVTQIAIEVCAALKHAHDHGIIHRDLKPANLLYSDQETIKLLDFGIAKLFGNTSVTTGSVMGTADYMAPEQAEGRAVSPKTDLYSLGSVMYALLAGRPPFVGKSVPEVVHKVRFEPPVPVNRVAPNVPIELDQLIEQLLEKNPQKRVPTALATAHRLKAMEHALSVLRETESTSRGESFRRGLSSQVDVSGSSPNDQETIRLEEDKRPGDEQVDQLTVVTQDTAREGRADHFTVVGAPGEMTRGDRFPWQIVPLGLLLAAIVWGSYWGIRWASQPASADGLFAHIEERASSVNPTALAEAEREMDEFLASYADDARAGQVRQWQQRLQLERLQRRLRDKARRGGEAVSAVEGLYLDILPLLETAPDLAAKRLQALADLYGQTNNLDAEQRQYVQLAQQQLAQLQADHERQAAVQLPVVRQQLAEAKALADTQPARARRIYGSIIELYDGKSWAQEVVRAARDALQASPGESDSPATDDNRARPL